MDVVTAKAEANTRTELPHPNTHTHTPQLNPLPGNMTLSVEGTFCWQYSMLSTSRGHRNNLLLLGTPLKVAKLTQMKNYHKKNPVEIEFQCLYLHFFKILQFLKLICYFFTLSKLSRDCLDRFGWFFQKSKYLGWEWYCFQNFLKKFKFWAEID